MNLTKLNGFNVFIDQSSDVREQEAALGAGGTG